MASRIHIICFGNPLHGDDGFGPAVCEALRQQSLPEGVRVLDAGIRGLDSLGLFEDCEHAILVDARVGDAPVGELHCLAPHEVEAEPTPGSHGAGLGQLLEILPEFLNPLPGLDVLVAETPPPVPFRMSLSPEVAAAVPRALSWIGQRISEKQQHV